ncbi:MAG: hypothetical protein J6B16_00265 [Clostridia bacterium]|nr:hypothetical protein [Clostridia bacterium]
MLYDKSKSKTLDDALFKNPTCEFRGAPFWAWNCKLDKDDLLWQIENFKDMGLGGFHMHVRAGMATKYLSDEYLDLIKSCVDKAKEMDMKAYLYDEDTWPSGFAGGYVTKHQKYRQRKIILSEEYKETVSLKESIDTGKLVFLAAYDINLNVNGELVSYKRIGKDDTASGIKKYVYLHTAENSDRMNKQSYVDVFNKEAINEFINVTHEKFKSKVGDEFGKTCPTIFTDEPQFSMGSVLKEPFSKQEVSRAWSVDFEDDFIKTKGYNILDKLPEVFWDLEGNKISKARYDFHDYTAERFRLGFNETLGNWCDNNNLPLTGHLMQEPTLWTQTNSVGECMRNYKHYGIPGIDLLHDAHEFNTAKQVQSIVRQYGKEGMLTELYGVTNWDFDFADHKHQGDWQMALGVTLRVPHLSWVSMKGKAKRDYPASINYQIPWHKQYGIIEDHFSRVCTALTRGKPICKVAVVHPIETYWLHFTTNNSKKKDIIDKHFEELTNILLFNCIDFDFISEADILNQKVEAGKTLKIGQMSYDAVIMPALDTIRENTLNLLNAFADAGGSVIMLDHAPKCVDAIECDKCQTLTAKAKLIEFNEYEIINAVEPFRTVYIENEEGKHCYDLIYQMREDTDCKWLFLAHGLKKHDDYDGKYVAYGRKKKIKVKGEYTPIEYNTMTGEILPLDYVYDNGWTIIKKAVYGSDSVLIKLTAKSDPVKVDKYKEVYSKPFRYLDVVPYEREDYNVVLLDQGVYRYDDGDWQENEYVINLSSKAKKDFNYPSAACQPWVMPDAPPAHTITVSYKFYSDISYKGAFLAIEDADKSTITFNGKPLNKVYDGWWADKCISKLVLPKIKKGENVLIVTLPYGARDYIEPCYILGDFDVKVQGPKQTIVKKSNVIGFGGYEVQGLPFYGGNLKYNTDYVADADGEYLITVTAFNGAFVKVFVDGQEAGNIVLKPYNLKVKLTKGAHKISYLVYGNRYNTFSVLHHLNLDYVALGIGPDAFGGNHYNEFAFEYLLRPQGIISSPMIEKIDYELAKEQVDKLYTFVP